VVAHEQKYGDVVRGKAVDTPGKLALLGLGGLAGLVGVPAEDDQIYRILYGVINNFVQRGQKIEQACGKPGGRVGASVGLDTEVQVSEILSPCVPLPFSKVKGDLFLEEGRSPS